MKQKTESGGREAAGQVVADAAQSSGKDRRLIDLLQSEVNDLSAQLKYEIERGDDNYASCERIKRKFEGATADLKEALDALQFVKAFFVNLEDGTANGDPLRAIREKYHAPVHAKIDAVLAKHRPPASDSAVGHQQPTKSTDESGGDQ